MSDNYTNIPQANDVILNRMQGAKDLIDYHVEIIVDSIKRSWMDDVPLSSEITVPVYINLASSIVDSIKKAFIHKGYKIQYSSNHMSGLCYEEAFGRFVISIAAKVVTYNDEEIYLKDL